MLPTRSLTIMVPLLALCACSVPDGAERTGTQTAPIIGGINDDVRSYVVGVGTPYTSQDPSSGPFCSGTLISRRTVLTAGHCYSTGQGPTGGMTAVFFGSDINAPLSSAVTVVATAKSVRRPGFSNSTLHNDLTLVQLAADAPSQPAPILRETMANTADWIGPNFTFVGYGNDGKSNYNLRRVVIFPIERVGPANDVGQDTGSGPIDETQFYYRVPKKNTCDGDSGGPAFVVRGGVEYLAGSTSYGDGPCKVDGVDARTDGPIVTAWIQGVIDQFEGTDPCRADGACDESCNTNNTLVDPDCAANHCGADGMCVLSCVNPPDPDCAPPANTYCGADGYCDPTCSSTDADCALSPDGGMGGGVGGSGGVGTGGSGGASAGGAGTGGSGGAGTGGSGDTGVKDGGGTVGAGGGGGEAAGGAGPLDGGVTDAGTGGQDTGSTGGCGCSVPGTDKRGGAATSLLAMAMFWMRRRRR